MRPFTPSIRGRLTWAIRAFLAMDARALVPSSGCIVCPAHTRGVLRRRGYWWRYSWRIWIWYRGRIDRCKHRGLAAGARRILIKVGSISNDKAVPCGTEDANR